MQRWILHVDMDAFFASVEQRDHPEYRGRPLIVGGIGSRGVVSTASYEARKFGVHSAMPMAEARRRCPDGIFVACNHRRYTQESKKIRAIMAEFSPLVEPLSLDEAFLDISGMERLYPEPAAIASAIKERIFAELGLTASAGVAPNKFLAKLASDLKKPAGLVIVRPGEERAFLRDLPIKRMWGVGPATAKLLTELGITTIGQLAAFDSQRLQRQIGQTAYEMQRLANGIDERPVESDYVPKSVGNEETFANDIVSRDEILRQLLALCEKVAWRLRRINLSGRTVTLKLRYASFKTLTRSLTLPEPTCYDEEIYRSVKGMLEKLTLQEGVRLLGVTVGNLQTSDGGQLSLFAPVDDKRQRMYEAVDKLRDRFGRDIVTKAPLCKAEKQETLF